MPKQIGTFALTDTQTKNNCNRKTALERSGEKLETSPLIRMQLQIVNVRLVHVDPQTSSVKRHR